MKKYLFVFIVFNLPINIFSQTYSEYYQLINKGDWALECEKDTSSFIKFYEDAFSKADAFLFDQLKLAKIFDAQSNWGKTEEYLDKVLLKGYPFSGLKTYNFYKTDNLLKERLQTMGKEYFNKFIVSIDFDLYSEIVSLTSTDTYLAQKAPKGDSTWRMMREKVFLKNLHELLKITKAYAYPGERKLGFHGLSKIVLIHNVMLIDAPEKLNKSSLLYIQPTKEDSMAIQELRNLLKPMVMSGDISPSDYMQLYDNIVDMVVGNQKIQYYGNGISRKTKRIIPILDIETVDERRAEIGLPTLYEYAKMKNVALPEGYILPKFVENE